MASFGAGSLGHRIFLTFLAFDVANWALGPSIWCGHRDGGRRLKVISDAELVAQVRLGDVEAFGELAQRYERTVLAVAIDKLHDFDKAEDEGGSW